MHCTSDVWVVCACLPMCIVACFVWFLGIFFFFGGSAFLHKWFLHFCKVVLGCFLRDGMKGYGVLWNVDGMMCAERGWICTPVSIRKAFARMCDAWG